MEQKQILQINSLPSPTWNWLKVNHTKVSWSQENVPAQIEVVDPREKMQTDILNMREKTPEEESVFWQIETSAGKETDVIFSREQASYVRIFGKKQDDGAKDLVVRVHIQGESKKQMAALANIVAKEGEQVTVHMDIRTPEDSQTSLAVRTYLQLEKNSTITLVQILLPGDKSIILNDLGGKCEEGAKINLIQIYLGKGDCYSGAKATLYGAKSNFTSSIAYLEQKEQSLDLNMVVDHFGRKTTSSIVAEGTMRDKARKLFRGTIDFKTGASESEGQEEENVLLLGNEIENKTVPLILCAEEDVVGNHGATIGELDDEVLFYLGARGIGRRQAEDMMTRAKIERVCNQIDDEETRKLVHTAMDEVMQSEGNEE